MPTPATTPAIIPAQFTTFGELLKYLRHRAGLSQSELSIAAGYSVSQISRLEKNQRAPDAAAIAARFVPELDLDKEPMWVARLLELATASHPTVEPKELEAEPQTLRHNLPIQLTSFIGRTRETAEVKRRLTGTRLLTLTGVGGSGKTRLALQVTQEAASEYAHGVGWVELAPLSDPSLVPNVVMSALELRDEAGRAPLDALTDYLRAKKLLLVLDNCEHLIVACAQLAHHLLTHCPNVQILATSREALDIGGEVIYQVPPLALPDPNHLPLPDSLSGYDAVRLFIERATAVQPTFVVNIGNAPAVAQICYRLDGIPLALELAAARIKLFSPEQIAAHLDNRFRLLTGGSRTATPRQQTLRAAIDWSYSLLSDAERVLFRSLSVFAGGWTFEAAEQVCAGDGLDALDVLETLAQLVNKSLVTTETRNDETRYRMLETIREYASERLHDAEEQDQTYESHSRFFLALANAANEAPPFEQMTLVDRLETEHDNLRAALRWSLQHDKIEWALGLCVALAEFWSLRGYWTESHIWFQRTLDAGRQDQTRAPSREYRALLASVLNAESHRAIVQGDFETGHLRLDESLVLYKALADEKGIVDVLFNRAQLVWYEGNTALARSLWEECLELARKRNDKSRIAHALWLLGILARERADYAAAHSLCEESLVYSRELGERGMIAWALENLGCVAMLEGEYERAEALFKESMTLRQQTGEKMGLATLLMSRGFLSWYQSDYLSARSWLRQSLVLLEALGFAPFLIAPCITGFAALDAVEGDSDNAIRLLGAAQAMLAATKRRLTDVFLDVHNRTVLTIRQQLNETEYNARWAEGNALTMKEAIALALAKGEVESLRSSKLRDAPADGAEFAAAISPDDWVSSHEKYGRNR